MASKERKQKDLKRWPFARRLWLKGFRELWERQPAGHKMKRTFKSPEDMFEWWLSDESTPKDCDMALFSAQEE